MPRGAGRYAEILDIFMRHIVEEGYDGTNFVASPLKWECRRAPHSTTSATKEYILATLHGSYVQRRLTELDRLLGVAGAGPPPVNALSELPHTLHCPMISQVGRDCVRS